MRQVLFIITFVWAMVAYGQTVPSTASSNFSSSDVYCSTARLSWTSGNGTARIIIASEGSPVSSAPATNTYYIGDEDFGDGYSFSPTEFVVYNGTGSLVILDNLKSNTTYYFEIFEYNGGGSTYAYQTVGTPTHSFTTENLSGSFTIDDTYQCLTDNSFAHTSSIVNSTGNTVFYSWNFDDGSPSDNSINPTHSFTDKGIFEVTLTLTSIGCEFEYTSNDTVAPQPSTSFELDPGFPNNTTPQCFLQPDGSPNRFYFDNTTVTSSFGGATSNTLYDWTYGDGNGEFQVIGDRNHSYSQPGIYNVKVIAYNTQNGKDFCKDSFNLDVEVRPSPIDSSLLSLDTAQCLNNNLFEFEHATSDVTISHNWTFGDGGSDVGSAVSHTYGSIGTFTVRLSAIDAVGCTAEYERDVNVATVPNNDFTGLAVRYCLGDSVATLTPTIAGGEWFGDRIDANGDFSPSTLGIADVSYTINVSGCIDTVTKSTEVFDIPVFEIGNDTSICSGTSFDKLVSPDGATVAWSTGGSDSSITITQGGLYWASRTQNGCSFRDSFEVEVITAPTVDLGPDTTLCGDGVVTIDIDASEATYTWSDGYIDSGERLITTSGIYSVAVSNKCGNDSDEVELIFLDYVCDIFIPSAFSPNGDELNNVFRPSGNVEILNMSIYTFWGELVYTSTTDLAWDGTYKDAPAQQGAYLYVIEYKLPVESTVQRKVAKGELYLVR